MPKAPGPAKSLPRACRVFEPARYSQHYLACAYLQLVPVPRRPVAAPLDAAARRPGAAARTAAS